MVIHVLGRPNVLRPVALAVRRASAHVIQDLRTCIRDRADLARCPGARGVEPLLERLREEAVAIEELGLNALLLFAETAVQAVSRAPAAVTDLYTLI